MDEEGRLLESQGVEMKDPRHVIESMTPAWLDIINKKTLPKHDHRTMNEACFDSGVMAAAEFVRRMMDGDESLALPMFDLCFFKRKERANAK
jgi:hypothetical protein